MDDYFAAEALILRRIAAELPDLRVVDGGRSLSEIQGRRSVSPAVYVLYDGQEALMGAQQAQVVAQKWVVVTMVRNARAWGTGERGEAGLLMVRLCQALLGWQPGPDHGPLTMATAPGPLFQGGVGFYPLRFITRIVLSGGSS